MTKYVVSFGYMGYLRSYLIMIYVYDFIIPFPHYGYFEMEATATDAYDIPNASVDIIIV
jgi:hypothetical protein